MIKSALFTLLMFTALNAQVTQDMNATVETNATVNINPYYQGDVVTVEQGGSYTYLEIKEKTNKTFWVAVNNADVKVGDYVRFQMELVTQNFKSKALKRTFDELMFGINLQQRIVQ